MPKALFVGGGSIGHIAPAVAVALALQKLRPDVEITFVCSKREEDTVFLEKEQFPYAQVDSPRLSLLFPLKFLKALRQAGNLLEVLKPQVIFSKGGYASLPLCFAAHKKNIPIVLHESDAVSGRTNRIAARWADCICLGFPKQKSPVTRHWPMVRPATSGQRLVAYVGNPLRPEITQGSKKEGSQITGFSGKKPVLLVIGGSQGAQALNEAVEKSAEELLMLCDIIHLTGRGKKGMEKQKGYWSKEFAHKELTHLYAITSVALSRAGANTIAELAANNIPAILVPLEGVAHNHQLKNAEVASQAESFILLRQKELNTNLVGSIRQLLTSEPANKRTGEPANASGQIAELLSKYLDSQSRHH